MILSFWVCIVWYTQSTQNTKFALSLQYLNEKVKDEGDFSDKRQIFLQLNTIILVVCDQACLDYSK